MSWPQVCFDSYRNYLITEQGLLDILNKQQLDQFIENISVVFIKVVLPIKGNFTEQRLHGNARVMVHKETCSRCSEAVEVRERYRSDTS